MKELKHMKECLISCVQNQISGHLDQVDAKELGEAIDMIKDLEEAIYYATITKAMEEKPLSHYNGHEEQPRYTDTNSMYRNEFRGDGGHSGNNYMPNPNSTSYASRNYNEPSYRRGGSSSYMMSPEMDPGAMGMNQHERDAREGTSPMYRKMYMESEEMKHDKDKQMKDLETYMQELSNDIIEMISDASPEERQMLHQKICMLATKIK